MRKEISIQSADRKLSTVNIHKEWGKDMSRAPKRTERLLCANAGSPTGRECAPRRTMLYPWYSQEELEECSWVNSLRQVER